MAMYLQGGKRMSSRLVYFANGTVPRIRPRRDASMRTWAWRAWRLAVAVGAVCILDGCRLFAFRLVISRRVWARRRPRRNCRWRRESPAFCWKMPMPWCPP